MTIQLFEFDGEPLRGVMIDGEPWMVAADVCRGLGIANNRDAISDLPDDEKQEIDLRNTVAIGDGIGGVGSEGHGRGNPKAVAVNEPGLYRLIFKSRKPEAERFKKWVFHEVLPAIRATGSFQARPQPEARPIDETMIAIPAAKYIEMLEFKIAVLQEKANAPRKEKRLSRGPLTDAEYQHIRELAEQGMSQTEISRTVGRSTASVSMALRICPVLPAAEGGAK